MEGTNMFKNITGFFINRKKDGEKKKLSMVENLIIIVIIGVVIILATSFLTDSGNTEGTMNDSGSLGQNQDGNQGQPLDGMEVVADMEKRLSELLSQVEGAGQVSVMIYADTSSEQIPAYNNEQDTRNDERTDGKSSEISETKELALSGDDTPVILKVMVPQIKGVVVVAEGAGDMLIREQLNNAVCTLLGIPEHRVQILKHK
jgi:stage III sporulation protein AG